MALERLGSQWCGVKRTFGNSYVETCYSLYADMEDGSITPHLRVNGFNVYATVQSDLSSILPVTLTVRANGGTVHTFTSGTTVLRGAYSPSGNWMQYFINISSEEQITIPGNGTVFGIDVTVTPSGGTALSFTESACGPISNTLTCPERMETGRVYTFTTERAIQVGTDYTTSAELSWYPKMNSYYTTQVHENGYVDPYTKASDATSAFNTLYFAVANPDSLSEAQAATLIADAQVTVTTRYNSADFKNGVLISEMLAYVPCSPRDSVDAELAPVLTSEGIAMSCSPASAEINGKYVHRQATLTCTPVAQFKYGDSLSYIHLNDTNRYASSISFQAIGVEPGESYTRADTGTTVTAGNESIQGVTVSVYGSKWRLQSNVVTKTYTVLWYQAPAISEFSLHRASITSTTTPYQYNNVYYKKDDFGAYCIIEYTVNFAPLDNTNTREVVLQYGTHRTSITVSSYSQSGFVVVSAPTTSTLDVIIALYDSFYPYGVAAKRTLSTGAILIDFLAGGKGMALGKVATEANTLDIADAWKLLFYQATVGGYNGAAAQDLIAWMHNIDTRLAHIEATEYANT